jgi:type IV fimbrial biogenesis protein FimT
MVPMKTRQSGFTLFELMVGIAVMGILLSLAVPSFREYGRNSRLIAFQNDLITALNYARNEAIRRSAPVSLCATANFTTCSAATADMATGWLVFTDETGTAGTLDGTDTLLQMWQGQQMTGLTLTSSGTNPRWIQFTSTGLQSPVVTKTYSIRSATCPSGQQRERRIVVSGIGAIRSDRTNCP